MSTESATVFVVDDDPSVRKSLTRLILAAGLKVVTFASAQAFLDQSLPSGPGCLVLDVRMPGQSGLDLQAELNARNIRTPVIFITGHGDIAGSVKAMRGGAIDFLTKPFKPKHLLDTIQKAIQKDARRQASHAENTLIQQRVQTLTPREREVLNLVIKGRLNKQIASELGAAERTIKVHRGRVMQKMQVTSVAELVHAIEQLKADGELRPSALD
jgi:FixJ family two-component response regulator